jgi:hypothetical protein
MNKFYIPEINLRDIRNNMIDILTRFEKNYNKSISRYNIIISNNGFYKYDKDKLIKYKVIEKESKITECFLKNYTLIELNYFEKKIGEVFQIPYETDNIIIEKIKFNIGESKNYIVFEKRNNRLIDLYFLSNKKIDEKCKFFIKDVSSFIEMLNI